MAEPIEIEIWRGAIAELEVDAIVIPANESLFMTAPVAAALKRVAGEEVERAAVAQGPIAAGSVVVTRGGRLAAPYVIHAVGVGHDLKPDRERLGRAVTSALEAVEHLSLRRIAMAPLGTERGVFPIAEAASILFERVLDHAARGSGTPESLVLAVTRAEDVVDVRAALQASRVGAEPMPPVEGR